MQQRSLSIGVKIGLVLTALALVAAAALNWHWLVAFGLLPIIVGLLPCAVMCGLHLCSANKGSNQTPGPMTKASPPGT